MTFDLFIEMITDKYLWEIAIAMILTIIILAIPLIYILIKIIRVN